MRQRETKDDEIYVSIASAFLCTSQKMNESEWLRHKIDTTIIICKQEYESK